MTQPQHNPNHDDLILRWVEGALSASEAAVVSQVLSSDPALRVRAMAMRQDRMTLISLGDSHPADLSVALQEMIEREALLAMEQGSAAGSIPRGDLHVSVRRRSRPAVAGSIRPARWARAALAAGFAVAGVGLVWAAMRAPWSSVVTPPGPITSTDPSPIDVPRPSLDALPDARTMASMTDSAPVPADPEVAPGTAGLAAYMPIDRALRLAGEGRLCIRVVTDQPDRLASGLSRRVSRARDWRVDATPLPQALASLVAPREIVGPGSPVDPSLGPILADSNEPHSTFDPVFGPRIEAFAPVGVQQRILLVASRIDGAALESLTEQLIVRTGRGVVFEELPVPTGMRPALSPEEVFWWSSSPETWAGWASIPIVLDWPAAGPR